MTQQVDRFGKCAVLNLNTEGFENLSIEKKHLVYHLTEAGLYGRDLFLQQNCEHNLTVKKTLETIFKLYTEKHAFNSEFSKFVDYLKHFWIHVGIYHGMSNKRLELGFTEVEFDHIIYTIREQLNQEDLELTRKVLFDPTFTKELKNIQKSGVDVVAESGGNFYKNLTSEEVDQYRKDNYPKGDNLPQYGFNSRLVKTEETGEITEEVVYQNGLYGNLVTKIMENLEKALKYTENDAQKASIQTLIEFYKTGSPEDFDEHSLEWVKDQESEVFFINGLIESYDDPKGIGCTFESLVAFKNPIQTAKVNKIIENIQWFETNMPVNEEYKKEEASGLSASSVTVAGMAGATSPTLPLGICLPNSDWIRELHGSKSVNLMNVHNARGESEAALKEEFILPEYLESVKKYGSDAGSLHTDLHEVAGHGSCKSNSGVSNEDLDIYYAVIEEARADLVGLYFINNPKLTEFEVIDTNINQDEFATAAYVNYLTNGSMLQLKRVDSGEDLSQPHMRNRQLITNWVLKNTTDNCVEIFEKEGKNYIKINDMNSLNKLFGDLLGTIQDIKSTGNYEAAKEIVETYGTIVNKELHQQVLERVSILDTPSTYGFTTPLYKAVTDDSGDIIDYETYQYDSFVEEQLYLSEKYC